MLPALMPFPGDWPAYEDGIYNVFCETLVDDAPFFHGKRLVCQYDPAHKGKHKAFWHCISEGEHEAERVPDIRRCERIAWIGWAIRNSGLNSDLLTIQQRRGSANRIVLVHRHERFAVVLHDGRNIVALVTAYCPSRRNHERLLKEHESQKD